MYFLVSYKDWTFSVPWKVIGVRVFILIAIYTAWDFLAFFSCHSVGMDFVAALEA